MEKFSNSITELYHAAKKEISLFELEKEEKTIAYFSQFPAIAGFPFKINLSQDSTGRIFSRFRQWDTDYDMKRWHRGIYNLSRLRIITEECLLLESEVFNFQRVIINLKDKTLPQKLHNDNAIVLDGVDWELGITTEDIHVHYEWRAATTEIDLFVPLIELLLTLHPIKRN